MMDEFPQDEQDEERDLDEDINLDGPLSPQDAQRLRARLQRRVDTLKARDDLSNDEQERLISLTQFITEIDSVLDDYIRDTSLRFINYTGTLTIEQAAQGIASVHKNAKDLVEDAELLFAHARWPRVVALCVLAVEEIGKINVIRILLMRRESELQDTWKSFRKHTDKSYLALFFNLPIPASHMNADKQLAFYVDCLGAQGDWATPDFLLDDVAAKQYLDLARQLVKGEPAYSTVAELELLVKHMKPVWYGSTKDVNEAWARFYSDAVSSGVTTPNQNVERQMKLDALLLSAEKRGPFIRRETSD